MDLTDVKFLYINGNSEGMIECRMGDYVDRIYRIPRSYLEVARAERELSSSCVYIQVFREVGLVDPSKVYVGQATPRTGNNESFYQRMTDHIHRGNDGWSEALVITSADRSLYPKIDYIEQNLYDKIKAAGRCSLQNENRPSGGEVEYREIPKIEQLIERAIFLIKHLGYRFFTPIDESEIEAAKVLLKQKGYKVKEPEGQSASSFQSPEFYLKNKKGIYATLVFLTPDFKRGVLKAGSRVQIKTALKCSGPAKKLRNTHLIAEKIEAYDDKHVKLKCDIDFSTTSYKEEDMCASLAAGFVSGNSMAASFWKTADNLTPEQYRNSIRHN